LRHFCELLFVWDSPTGGGSTTSCAKSDASTLAESGKLCSITTLANSKSIAAHADQLPLASNKTKNSQNLLYTLYTPPRLRPLRCMHCTAVLLLVLLLLLLLLLSQ
jgi:hypothetical protein